MPEYQGQGSARRALVVLLGVVFVNIAGFGVVIPLLPFYGRAFHASTFEIGVMFSAFAVGQLFAEAFWGRLSDRVGRRPVLIATIFGTAAAYAALAFAPNMAAACALRLAGGLMSGNISTIQGYLADVTPLRERAGRMGLLGSAFSMGFVTGPALGGLLARPQDGVAGFHLPLLAAAGLAGLSAIGVVLFVRETRAAHHMQIPPTPRLQSLVEAARHPVIARVLLMSFIVVSGFAGIEATYGLWTQARFGWGPRQIGFAFMVVGVTGAIAQGLVTGPLARRYGGARVLTVGLALVGVGMLVQLLSPNWPVAMAGFFTVSFGQSLTFPNIAALISQAAPPERQGEMLGLNMAGNCLARVGGPIYAGAVFSGVSIGAPFATAAALIAPALVMATQVARRTRTAP
ncbi:MAG TPA: MFS transporter [Caulobacteraceae bacterium]|nr:MFS transporter [Caulobacteraceae bacterium]